MYAPEERGGRRIMRPWIPSKEDPSPLAGTYVVSEPNWARRAGGRWEGKRRREPAR